MSVTLIPARARPRAPRRPTGPAPTTRTSHSFITNRSAVSSRAPARLVSAKLRLVQIQSRRFIAEADGGGQMASTQRILQKHAACNELRILERLGQRFQRCVADIEPGQPSVPFIACLAG